MNWVIGSLGNWVIGEVAAAVALVAFAAAGAVVSEYSNARGFTKRWVMSIVAVVRFAVCGALLGEVMLSALCASVWVCA
jgi:hypothetical protein